MSEEKGLSVAGYRPTQSAENIAKANQVKQWEERFYRLVDEMNLANGDAVSHGQPTPYDGRDVSIARTHIQEGCSAMVRAIFRPTRIALPEDAE